MIEQRNKQRLQLYICRLYNCIFFQSEEIMSLKATGNPALIGNYSFAKNVKPNLELFNQGKNISWVRVSQPKFEANVQGASEL